MAINKEKEIILVEFNVDLGHSNVRTERTNFAIV